MAKENSALSAFKKGGAFDRKLSAMKENIDPYLVLRLSRQASSLEVKKAFHLMARKYHPDKNKGNRLAAKRFQQINLAYQILSHPERRKAFDEEKSLKAKQQAKQAFEKKPQEKAINLSLPLSVSLEDLFSEKPLPFDYFQPMGGRQKKSRISLKLPKGAFHGTKLKFAGRGGGLGFKAIGDLYIQIQLKAHPLFQWRGRDIFLDMPLNIFAAEGMIDVKAPTIEGQALLKLPSLKKGEAWLRLKGQGLFKERGEERGDMLVRLFLEFPKGAEAEAERDLKAHQMGRGAALPALHKKYKGLFPKSERFQRRFKKLLAERGEAA